MAKSAPRRILSAHVWFRMKERVTPTINMKENNKTISLSHGSGGKLTHSLIRNLFVRHFDNPLLVKQGDSSIFPNDNRYLAMTTDSYVVSPLVFPGGDIGKLAVSGTVNDLSVSGERPLYLSAGFIIEEGFAIDTLEQIVISMARTAKDAGVSIITGDTKVVEKGKCDGLFITTTGIGAVEERWREIASGSNIKVGDTFRNIEIKGLNIVDVHNVLDELARKNSVQFEIKLNCSNDKNIWIYEVIKPSKKFLNNA